ncbi:MAG TPA: GntR family transcriptional regulator [Acidimicrobiia bacterium]|nr:GntR family transcriptional regulator [Acidimicrobiia bacterium]
MALPIQIDKQNGVPVYIQLTEQIRLLIREGVLKTGAPMPTVRSLAVDLGINANTVARVYHELATNDLLRTERGRGTFVAEDAGEPMHKQDFLMLEREVLDLVRSAKEAGMTAKEVCQFVETRWKRESSKESSDVSR